MPRPLLYDATTLRHFSACGCLSVCEALHSPLPLPRWTDAIRAELERGAALGNAECDGILTATWLGAPVTPAQADEPGILKVWIALNGGHAPPQGNAGEAQSIYFAGQLDGTFATDDNAAYDFAQRRLGADRAVDTVDILRAAVRAGHLRARDARDAANAIRTAGRYLRRIHPGILTEAYFT